MKPILLSSFRVRGKKQKKQIRKSNGKFKFYCDDDTNFRFYNDCITHSIEKYKMLPKFYAALEDDDIINSLCLTDK